MTHTQREITEQANKQANETTNQAIRTESKRNEHHDENGQNLDLTMAKKKRSGKKRRGNRNSNHNNTTTTNNHNNGARRDGNPRSNGQSHDKQLHQSQQKQRQRQRQPQQEQSVQDEIEEQLARQRRKRALSNNDDDHDDDGDNGINKDNNDDDGDDVDRGGGRLHSRSTRLSSAKDGYAGESGSVSEMAPSPPMYLGDYKYDPKRRAYFPKHAFSGRPTDGIGVVEETDSATVASDIQQHLARTRRINIGSMHGSVQSVIETTPGATKRERIRSLWIGRRMASETRFLSTSVYRSRGGWASFLPQLKRNHGTNAHSNGMPWDLECKSRLHPSTQTFDVQPLERERFPNIVTDVNDGFFLRLGIKEPKIWTERRYLSDEWYILTRALDG